MIDSGKVPIGRALDLGLRHRHERDLSRAKRFCGNGRRYLAARHLAGEAQSPIGYALTDRVRFERGDVSLMRRWATGQSIDFAYDIGCLARSRS